MSSGTSSASILEVDSVEFWFMMQIAMLCGFRHELPRELVAATLRHQGDDVRIIVNGRVTPRIARMTGPKGCG